MTNNHLAPRTIREWLELIPFDRARKEAIENLHIRNNDIIAKGLVSALYGAFTWSDSPQGSDYWSNVCDTIKNMEQSVKLKQ